MKRLLLVGAGHAHLEILRRLILEPLPGVELTMVSLGPLHHYSGMVPGYLQGTYTEEQIAVRVPDLVARAGGRFVAGRAVRLDPVARTVGVEEEIGYDLVSFAVGSNTAGDPGAAARIKPLERAVVLRRRLAELRREDAPVDAVLVGGGAAGVELALVIHRALGLARVTILESGDWILNGYPERFRDRAQRILQDRGIAVRLRSRVLAVHPEEVEIEGGATLPSRLTVWLTGAVGWPLFRDSGLPVDERGFLWLDDSLRSVADPRVFAAGDCGTLASHPETPKAGVYAVREAPVLWESLKASIRGGAPPRYVPQERYLSILNTADGRALLDSRGIVSHSRWAWRLKDAIDRRFMARYQSLLR